ncbi:hypothetical protein [Nocardioides sp. P5_C9_2]
MTRVRRWSPSALVARGLLLVLPLVAAGAAWQRPATLFVLLLVVLGGLWAAMPESPAGPVVLLLVAAWWGARVDDPLDAGVLLAAGALVAAHVAGVLASYGPARMPLDRATTWLWVRRGLLAWLVAPVAWVAARGLDAAPDQPTLWTVGLVTVGVLVVAAGLALREAPTDG